MSKFPAKCIFIVTIRLISFPQNVCEGAKSLHFTAFFHLGQVRNCTENPVPLICLPLPSLSPPGRITSLCRHDPVAERREISALGNEKRKNPYWWPPLTISSLLYWDHALAVGQCFLRTRVTRPAADLHLFVQTHTHTHTDTHVDVCTWAMFWYISSVTTVQVDSLLYFILKIAFNFKQDLVSEPQVLIST